MEQLLNAGDMIFASIPILFLTSFISIIVFLILTLLKFNVNFLIE